MTALTFARATTVWRQGIEVFGLRFRQHMDKAVLNVRHQREFAALDQRHRMEREALGLPVDQGMEEA